MTKNTKIQWTDHTFNPWIGCAKINTACKNCYAETLMATRYGRVTWGTAEQGGTRLKTKTWNDPLRWNREAEAAGERATVFCASLADVFESGFSELFEWRKDLFRLIDLCGWLNWQLLTKRPINIANMWHSKVVCDANGTECGVSEPTAYPVYRDNCWLGTSVGDQATADDLIPQLMAHRNRSPVLFLSLEPLVGPVDLAGHLSATIRPDWVIIGGESGHGARPLKVSWVADIVEQCQWEGVPVFVKQLGTVWARSRSKTAKGDDPAEWPIEMQRREFPPGYLTL